MDKTARMKELIELLNKASDEYYNKDNEIMSNLEYDAMFDELVTLEKETGSVLPDSPTQNVGSDTHSGLKKEQHEVPALSLDKTKDIDQLAAWLGNRTGVLSWKMDGLTIVATYENGKLKKAVTRGNGHIGENITQNAKYFNGLPKTISFNDKMVIRGEAIIGYSEFERINDGLEEPYKNPRNLASGTVRALDTEVVKSRRVDFYAFQVVTGLAENSFFDRLTKLREFGINTVEFQKIDSGNADSLRSIIESWEKKIETNDFPTDGLVMEYDDIAYGESLGTTGHHPRYGLAFKWADEIVESEMLNVEWSASRTGLLNPVAIFKPVEIESTTVSRASIHNWSVMEGLHLHKDDRIGVYKANMIIPQISENLSTTHTGDAFTPPENCPICNMATEINCSKDGIKTVICVNKHCPAKMIGQFERFVDRDAMNIEGLSTATIEALINHNLIRTPADLYYLKNENTKAVITNLEGFGEKSYNNLIQSIEKSRTTTFERYLYSLGISEIGRSQSKEIKKYLQTIDGDGLLWDKFIQLLINEFDFTILDGFGKIMNDKLHEWFQLYREEWMEDLVPLLTFENEAPETITSNWITNKTFVVTGSVNHFNNRDELKAFIESHGGKVSGSVSSKTDYLINNDVTSTSGKNKKAKELGIPIISEDEFLSHTDHSGS